MKKFGIQFTSIGILMISSFSYALDGPIYDSLQADEILSSAMKEPHLGRTKLSSGGRGWDWAYWESLHHIGDLEVQGKLLDANLAQDFQENYLSKRDRTLLVYSSTPYDRRSTVCNDREFTFTEYNRKWKSEDLHQVKRNIINGEHKDPLHDDNYSGNGYYDGLNDKFCFIGSRYNNVGGITLIFSRAKKYFPFHDYETLIYPSFLVHLTPDSRLFSTTFIFKIRVREKAFLSDEWGDRYPVGLFRHVEYMQQPTELPMPGSSRVKASTTALDACNGYLNSFDENISSGYRCKFPDKGILRKYYSNCQSEVVIGGTLYTCASGVMEK